MKFISFIDIPQVVLILIYADDFQAIVVAFVRIVSYIPAAILSSSMLFFSFFFTEFRISFLLLDGLIYSIKRISNFTYHKSKKVQFLLLFRWKLIECE